MPRMRRLALAIALVAGLAAPAGADFDDGVVAYISGDYATALREYRLAAEQGDASAQNNLGVMYAMGRGVAQDDALAAQWYRRAAEQGDARAQYNLGFMYADGRGVARDYALAVKWYRLAADHGDAGAQNNLGFMYLNGGGVPMDHVQAHMWFDLAAAQGYKIATVNLEQVARTMSAAEVTKAQEMAREWLAKHGKAN